jgi:hypothetical protein
VPPSGKRCCAVEGAEAVGSTAVGSKGLTVSGRQPGAKDARRDRSAPPPAELVHPREDGPAG